MIAELEEGNRLGEVLQPVLAELAQVVRDELPRRLRDENLAAVPDCGDPGAAMNVETDVPLLGDDCLACVEPHPHPDRAVCKRGLPVTRSSDRVGGSRKGDKERVPLRIDLDPAVRREGVAKGSPMRSKRRRVLVAELVQQASRARDVGEEERDRARRKVAHAVKSSHSARS